jgi:hypothetical protein|tara:strand:+ start:417 stop:1127 length:711 start_codon:yes stop_codon:yes gene_type:complete
MSKQTDLINVTDAITVSGSNVGIGTSSLDLVGSTTSLTLDHAGGNGQLSLKGNGTVYGRIFADNATGDLKMGNPTSNDVMFYTANLERMRIDATGAVTMPTQPAFLVRPSVGQTNLPNGVTTVIFGTEIFDQNSDFASNTFTAPVAGKYHLDANLWLEQVDTAINYLYLRLLTSNRNYNDIISPRFSSDPTYWNFQCSVLADMDAGDTASVLYSQSGTSAQVDIGDKSFFSGYLVA